MTALPHTSPGARPGPFIATREHRRFTEFATAVRRHGYIGLCYGPAGVGKTLSARRYARWDTAEPYLLEWGPRQASDAAIKAMLNRSRAVLYTPTILTSPRQLDDDLRLLMHRVQLSIYEHLHPKPGAVPRYRGIAPYVELVIIDEAERLRPHVLEHLRARFDVERMGLILIGMPGIEKRLARYPQLYSRVGFAHHYRPLSNEELLFVLTRHCDGSARNSTAPTSPTPKPSPPSPGSPTATSASSSGCSHRSNASLRSTTWPPSQPTSSRQPAAPSSSAPHNAEESLPRSSEDHKKSTPLGV
jgi:AAA domain